MNARQKFSKELTIQFSGLKQGKHDFDFELGQQFFDAFDLNEFQNGNLSLHISLDKQSTLLVFDFALNGEVTVPCDRCTQPFSLPLKGKDKFVARFTNEIDTPTFDDNDDQVIMLPESEHKIDLSDLVYELYCLSLPAKKVHQIADCDPEVLKYLVDSDPEEQGTLDEVDENDIDWEEIKKLFKNK